MQMSTGEKRAVRFSWLPSGKSGLLLKCGQRNIDIATVRGLGVWAIDALQCGCNQSDDDAGDGQDEHGK